MEIISLDNDGTRQIISRFGSPFEEVGGEPSVLMNIINYTKKYLGCKTVAIERKYICKDYRSEFSQFYSKAFTQVESLATRLHFFDREVRDDKSIMDSDADALGYCGYVVIRPTKTNRVGRTILKPARGDPNSDYCICVSNNESHLLGKRLIVQGAPFIQQDSMLMCCAHSAIWTSAKYMHGAFKFPEVLPHEINEAASRSYTIGTRVLPTEGLSEYDMLNCLLNLRYSPILFRKPRQAEFMSTTEFTAALERWNPVRNIYRYVESGFPVIVLVPNHVIVALGHTFFVERQLQTNRAKLFDTIEAVFSDEWVNAFIHHDDTAGPYRLIPRSSADAQRFKAQGLDDLLPSPRRTYNNAVDDIQGYLVPLPEKVYILAEHIDDTIKGILDNPIALSLFIKTKKFADAGNQMAQQFVSSAFDKNNPLVLRTYVTESTKYKSVLSQQKPEDVPGIVRHTLMYLDMPRYVWVVDITNAANISKKEHSERKLLGQIILDATGNKFAMPYLAIHFPGSIWLPRTGEAGGHDTVSVEGDYPRAMVVRKHMLES